jgi:hypothetical protein
MTARVAIREIEGIEAYLVERTEDEGALCLKYVCPGRRGAPDRIVIWPEYGFARHHFVETKTTMVNGVRTPLKPWQIRFHKDLRAKGAKVFVLYTRADVDRYVERYRPLV